MPVASRRPAAIHMVAAYEATPPRGVGPGAARRPGRTYAAWRRGLGVVFVMQRYPEWAAFTGGLVGGTVAAVAVGGGIALCWGAMLGFACGCLTAFAAAGVRRTSARRLSGWWATAAVSFLVALVLAGAASAWSAYRSIWPAVLAEPQPAAVTRRAAAYIGGIDPSRMQSFDLAGVDPRPAAHAAGLTRDAELEAAVLAQGAAGLRLGPLTPPPEPDLIGRPDVEVWDVREDPRRIMVIDPTGDRAWLWVIDY